MEHKLLLFTFFTTVFIPAIFAQGINYGPSLVQLTKYNKEIRQPTLFTVDSGRTINLEDFSPHFSTVVPLMDNSSTATSNQVFIYRTIFGPGEFTVKAPPGFGIIAVIQKLDLRPGLVGCTDFIQFSGDFSSKNESDTIDHSNENISNTIEEETSSGMICGKIDHPAGIGGIETVSSLYYGKRSFVTLREKMKVLFYHGYLWGLVRNFNSHFLHPHSSPVLRAEIAFTAFKLSTNSSKIPGFTQCGSSPFLISKNLFCDRILNCGFLTTEFGIDENPISCIQQYDLITSRTVKQTTKSPKISDFSPIMDFSEEKTEPHTFYVDTPGNFTILNTESGKSHIFSCMTTIAILTIMLIIMSLIAFTFLGLRLYKRMWGNNSEFWIPGQNNNNSELEDGCDKKCAVVVTASVQTEVPPAYDKLYPVSP